MSTFLKAAAGILTALILWLSIQKNNKDISVLLTLAVCAMIMAAAMNFLRPVIDFIRSMEEISELDKDLMTVILKVVGIGLIGEFSVLICKDAGNEAMGKSLQIMASVVVLWISLPVFQRLLALLNKILGAV